MNNTYFAVLSYDLEMIMSWMSYHNRFDHYIFVMRINVSFYFPGIKPQRRKCNYSALYVTEDRIASLNIKPSCRSGAFERGYTVS